MSSFASFCRWFVLPCALLMAQAPTAIHAQSGAALPALGDGAEMSLSAERRLGDRIARQLYRDPDYLDDPVLGDYVQTVWQRLLVSARARGELLPELEERFAWDILLGRDRSVNAFALPGGYLGVHLGLIAAVTSADELASVMAHELSHVTQRHIARMVGRQEAQGPWVLAAMILGALAVGSNPQAASAMIAGGQAVAIQGQLNFSRDMEREADRVGYGVMAQAGFEPQGFVSMFEKLQQASRLNDTGGFPYLRSHPLTTERIADMQARHQLQASRVAQAMSLEHALVVARARALSLSGQDALRNLLSQARAGQNQPAKLPQQAGNLYAAVLAAIELRDLPQAQSWFDQLRALVRQDTAAERLVRLLGAELALKRDQPERALEQLAPLRQEGQALARPELFLWAQALARSGQASLSAQHLQTWLARHPRDALAWQLIAAAYLAQGRAVAAVRAEAEAFAVHQDYEAARNRLRAAQDMARKAGGGDYIEMSIVDTRLRQVETRLREQALER
ncbi:MAG: M48 family metalloprotease [Hylemonella sp.]